jgi:hypothetical protein
MNIDGLCDPKFSNLRDAFAENFARRGEPGPRSPLPSADASSPICGAGGAMQRAARRGGARRW